MLGRAIIGSSMLAEAGHGTSASSLPQLTFSESTGFTFAATAVGDVVVGSSKKDVRAMEDGLCSVVTEQVVVSSVELPCVCTFQIKSLPPNGIFAWVPPSLFLFDADISCFLPTRCCLMTACGLAALD